MTLNRNIDGLLAGSIAMAMLAIVFFKGDALFLGFWYYIAVPVVILGASTVLKPAPLFLFGASTALAISMLAVMSVNWQATRPEGLLGLAHIFSLPGAFATLMVAAYIAGKKQLVSSGFAYVLGFAGFGMGYFVNQMVICNTVMWCGFLSMPIK